ncbi:hypothetical protein [Lentzea sp. NPDC051838]|uniref:hypothetical protein n=1 Tax=Lentzea sp. NPDC051838 TaxID=3154849 RepID=UPI003437C4B6
MDWVHQQRGSTADRVQVVTTVRPYPHLIGLSIADESLNAFLAEALPRQYDGELYGGAGVRVRVERDHLVLQVLGTNPPAQARVYGVGARRWGEAVEFMSDHQHPEVNFWKDHRREIHPVEETALRRRSLRPHDLMSAVLRRYALWQGANWCDSTVTGEDLHVRWSKGPDRFETASVLTHPACGIPGVKVIPEELSIGQQLHLTYPPRPERAARRQREAPEDVRASFTGETVRSAALGLSGFGLGLDSCSASQRELRALLALHVFNAGTLGAPPARRCLDALTCYDLIMSPRHDELVIFATAPDNVAGRLVGSSPSSGLPGLRIECRPAGDIFRLVHLPTGARLTISRRDEPPSCDAAEHEHGWDTRGWLTVKDPLGQQEITDLAALPPRSPEMAELLGAILVRVATRDPAQRWAIGTWFHDPLGRDREQERSGSGLRRLWGANDHWELEWGGYPSADDLVLSLTDPEIGLRKLHVAADDRHTELRFHRAVLRTTHLP